jgi:predicted aldo/keto reductase-like oxidoreductase
VGRFLRELGTDYLDIVLLHGRRSGDWNVQYRPAMNALSEAKDKGLVKAVGISCHGLDALKVAATEPWVDVILARINYADTRMDASTDQVLPVLQTASDNGKGIYAMKVLGCGPLASEPEKAIRYVLNLDCIHAMTIGHTEDAQLEQNVAIVERLCGQLDG